MDIKELKPRVKKGLWKPDEDMILKNYVEAHGEGNWASVSQKSGKATSLSLSLNASSSYL